MEITGNNYDGRLCRECGGTEGLKRSVTREYIRKVENVVRQRISDYKENFLSYRNLESRLVIDIRNDSNTSKLFQECFNKYGFFTDISETIGNAWLRGADIQIPPFCIYVGSRRMIKDVEKGPDVLTAGWSIFEQKDSKDYNMAFCSFKVTDEKGPREAGQFLEDYIVRRYNGTPLTNYDEKERQLPAMYEISRIKQGEFNMRAIHELILKIRQEYPQGSSMWESRKRETRKRGKKHMHVAKK